MLTHRLNDDYDAVLHARDHWLDEILLVRRGDDGCNHPLLRLTTKYRYKTSGMSGDEWRTSTVWQAVDGVPIQGDCEPDPRSRGWNTFDGGYGGQLEVGCAALYPGLYSSQPQIHNLPVHQVLFFRKGRILYGSSYDGEPRPLLTVAGHLPWALIDAKDQPLGTEEAWADVKRLCMQPGCEEEAVSTYRLKKCFSSNGTMELPAVSQRHFPVKKEVPLVRRFCPLHLRRGDCGLEDADSNYEVIEGPGPDKAVGWREFESRSRQVVL